MLKNIIKQFIVLQLVLGSTAVLANTYNFNLVPSNNGNPNIGSQLSVNVTANGTTGAFFKVMNNVGTPSNVAEIYFDYELTNFFSSLTISSQSGIGPQATTAVNFTSGANPQNLPGGNQPSINFSSDVAFDNGNQNTGGLNEIGDFIVFSGLFNTNSSSTYANLINALNNNQFEVGLHVRSIAGVNDDDGGSDSYITGLGTPPNAVPLPAAGWLFGSTLIGLIGLRRKMH